MHFIYIIVFYHKKPIINECIIRILIELELSFSYHYTSLKTNGCIPDDTSKHGYKRLFCLFFLTLRKLILRLNMYVKIDSFLLKLSQVFYKFD